MIKKIIFYYKVFFYIMTLFFSIFVLAYVYTVLTEAAIRVEDYVQLEKESLEIVIRIQKSKDDYENWLKNIHEYIKERNKQQAILIKKKVEPDSFIVFGPENEMFSRFCTLKFMVSSGHLKDEKIVECINICWELSQYFNKAYSVSRKEGESYCFILDRPSFNYIKDYKVPSEEIKKMYDDLGITTEYTDLYLEKGEKEAIRIGMTKKSETVDPKLFVFFNKFWWECRGLEEWEIIKEQIDDENKTN